MYFSQFELPTSLDATRMLPKEAQDYLLLDPRKMPTGRPLVDPSLYYRTAAYRPDLIPYCVDRAYLSYLNSAATASSRLASPYTSAAAYSGLYAEYLRQQQDGNKLRMISELGSSLETSRFAEHLQRLRDQHLQSKCTGACCYAVTPCSCCLQGQTSLCPRNPVGCLGAKDPSTLYGMVAPPARPAPYCPTLLTDSSVATSTSSTGVDTAVAPHSSILSSQTPLWNVGISLSNKQQASSTASSFTTPVNSKKKEEFKPWKDSDVIVIDEEKKQQTSQPTPAKMPRLEAIKVEDSHKIETSVGSYMTPSYNATNPYGPPNLAPSAHPIPIVVPRFVPPKTEANFSKRTSAFVPVTSSRVPSPVRYLPDETKSTPVQDKTVLKKLLASDPQLGLSEPTGTEDDILQEGVPVIQPPPSVIRTPPPQENLQPKVASPPPDVPTKCESPEKAAESPCEESKNFRKRLLAKLYQQRTANGELTWRQKKVLQGCRALHRRRRLRSGLDMISKPRKKKSKDLSSSLNLSTGPKAELQLPSSDGYPQIDPTRLHVNKSLGETTLHRAARQGYADVVERAIRAGQDVNSRDNAGYTPLHECCARGHLRIARTLLEHGADPNASAAAGGVRPLHDAVENDHVEVVRLLLSYGADPTLATYSGLTPVKLSRSPTMYQFLQGFLSDVMGGDSSDDRPSLPWRFRGSATCFDGDPGGYDIWSDLPPEEEPSAPEDDLQFEVSELPLLPTFRLSTDSGPPSCNWLRLPDVLRRVGAPTKEEFLKAHPYIQIISIPRHHFESSATCNQLPPHLISKSLPPYKDGDFVDLVPLDNTIRTLLGIEIVSLR